MFSKKWLAIVIALIIAPAAYAEINGGANPILPFINITAPNEIDGLTLGGTTVFSSGVVFSSSSTVNNTVTFNSSPVFNSGPTIIDTHYATFGNSLLQNPLTQTVFESFTTASANAGVPVLISSANRKIFPGAGLSIMVSGAAAGATSVNLQCEPSGRLITTWPIAAFVSANVPVGIYVSSAGGVPTVVLGSALNNGCSASDAIYLSDNGTLTGTSQLFVNLPYVQQ